PSNGEVHIDGVNISEIDLNDWWRRTTTVFQDFQKFQLLNVRENIVIGQMQDMNDMDKIQQATLLSGADEMIQNLPNKYETKLGKEFGGHELSQGQWQRIAVSRAYMRYADILILDEPTASLDAKA